MCAHKSDPLRLPQIHSPAGGILEEPYPWVLIVGTRFAPDESLKPRDYEPNNMIDYESNTD